MMYSVIRRKLMENDLKGHFYAALTMFIWGLTFISTKILLEDFTANGILLIRFLLGYVALLMISRRKVIVDGWRKELLFVLAGLSGICLYYLFENIAISFTDASNVGLIISVAPFFTAILSRFLLKGERLDKSFSSGSSSLLSE